MGMAEIRPHGYLAKVSAFPTSSITVSYSYKCVRVYFSPFVASTEHSLYRLTELNLTDILQKSIQRMNLLQFKFVESHVLWEPFI